MNNMLFNQLSQKYSQINYYLQGEVLNKVKSWNCLRKK